MGKDLQQQSTSTIEEALADWELSRLSLRKENMLEFPLEH